MADATAQLNNYRQSPRKVRLIADLVRGKSATRALALLANLPKRGSDQMSKLIKSAVANAKSKGFEQDDLYISHIDVGQGVIFKRFMPRARGKASPIKKKSSHIMVALSKRAPKVVEATPRETSGQAN